MLAVLALSCTLATPPIPATAPANAFAAIKPISVLRTSDGASVPLTAQWTAEGRAVVVLMRSFG